MRKVETESPPKQKIKETTMSVEVGKSYYIMQHAYHHFLGEVVEILGKNSIVINKVRRIYSCQRGWTEFFRDGCKTDTTFTIFPDGYEIHGYMSAAPWKHKIPNSSAGDE